MDMEKVFLLINTATYMREQCNMDKYDVTSMMMDDLEKNGFTDEEKEEIEKMEIDDVWKDDDYEGVIVVRVM